MLIELVNIPFEDINLSEDEERRRALENIFNSHGSRNHLVISDTSTMNRLLEVGENVFGLSTMTFIRDARDMLRETRSLKSYLNIYLQVDFSERYLPRHTTSGSSDMIETGYNYFVDINRVSPTLLIGEHINDAKLYKTIGTHYAKFISSLSLNIAFQTIHGGGSTTKAVFDNYKDQNSLAFCILDTDKKYPNDSEKSTATNFSRSDRLLNRSVKAMIINAHEVESIIPLPMIIDMMNSPTSTYGSDTLTNAQNLTNYSNSDFRRYFDHKNGISLKDAIQYDISNHGDYWLNFFNQDTTVSSKECVVNRECHECNRCPKVNGLGDGLLNCIVEFAHRNNTRKYDTTMEQFIRDEWENIGKELLSWGCTPATRVSRTS